jgi:hypothetical protein
VGRAAAQLLARGGPILLAYVLVYPDLIWPPTLWHWLALSFSLAFALLAVWGQKNTSTGDWPGP